jgi:tetratricopeptide (TPR) repeat protein
MFAFLGGKSVGVDELVAQKKYDQAIELLSAQLKESPGSVRLRMQLGDILARAERAEEAVGVLLELADEFAGEGFVTKAVAILKKVQRIDPRRPGIDRKLAQLAESLEAEAGRRSGAFARTPAPVAEDRDLTLQAQQVVSTGGDQAPLRSPLFSDFSHEELLAVIQGLRLLTLEPGEILMSEGEPGASLFLLTTGSVRAYVKNGEGRNVQVRMMEENEFFGEISLLSGKPRSATITAATPCELLELDRPTVEAIARDHPLVWTVIEEFSRKRAGSADEALARAGRSG